MNAELKQRVQAFKEDGFTVFKNVFDEATMAEWKEIHAWWQKQGFSGTGVNWWLSSTTELAPKAMMPVVANPMILAFAERVLGPFVQLDNLTLAAFPSMKREDAAGRVSGWHRDRWGQLPQTSDYIPPLSINAITYLQDLTDETGPLRVIPKSHRMQMGVELDERSKPHAAEQLVYLNAGDVVIIHNGLIHSGTPNVSEDVRFFFSIYYNRSWLRTTDNHSGPNVRKIVEDARGRRDRRVMRLFGEDALLEKRANSGFMVEDEEMWDRWIEEDRAELQAGLDEKEGK